MNTQAIIDRIAEIDRRLTALEKRTTNGPDSQVQLERYERAIRKQFQKAGLPLATERTNRKPKA